MTNDNTEKVVKEKKCFDILKRVQSITLVFEKGGKMFLHIVMYSQWKDHNLFLIIIEKGKISG
jgi:hypothetical protein